MVINAAGPGGVEDEPVTHGPWEADPDMGLSLEEADGDAQLGGAADNQHLGTYGDFEVDGDSVSALRFMDPHGTVAEGEIEAARLARVAEAEAARRSRLAEAEQGRLSRLAETEQGRLSRVAEDEKGRRSRLGEAKVTGSFGDRAFDAAVDAWDEMNSTPPDDDLSDVEIEEGRRPAPDEAVFQRMMGTLPPLPPLPPSADQSGVAPPAHHRRSDLPGQRPSLDDGRGL